MTMTTLSGDSKNIKPVLAGSGGDEPEIMVETVTVDEQEPVVAVAVPSPMAHKPSPPTVPQHHPVQNTSTATATGNVILYI